MTLFAKEDEADVKALPRDRNNMNDLKKFLALTGLSTALSMGALAQVAIPPVPGMRPDPQAPGVVQVVQDQEAPNVAVTRSPAPGDLLFGFEFSNADVLDFTRELQAINADEADGVLLPKQLLINPSEYTAITVRFLDKITTDLDTITIAVGQSATFGTLELSVDACLKNPSNQTPEAAGFLRIFDTAGAEEPIERFSGWMFSSSPALNALDHAVYDVWVIDCVNRPLG